MRRNDFAVDQVVGEVEHAANQGRVAGNSFCKEGVTVARWRQALANEAALGAERDDNGVFDHLRLDESQHFGAEVFLAIGPAQTTTGDGRATQVNAFHTHAVDENFVKRHGFWQEGQLLGGNLERQVGFSLAVSTILPGIGAQCGVDGGAETIENAVVVDVGNLRQFGVELFADGCGLFVVAFG